jgi:uncharacterized protein
MKKVLSLLLLVLFAVAAFARIPLPQKNTYVNDFAHILTKKQEKLLNKRIRAFENKTSVQMAVVLVSYLPAGYTIEDYATLIGRKWHVGRANNGLVYVAAIKQHKQRLEVAQNIQKYITDERAANVLDLLKIDLKGNLYYDAMKTLVDRSAVELADGKKEWIAAEKIRIAEKNSADSTARTDALMGVKAGGSGLNVWYFVVGAIALFIFWKPISYMFRLILVRIFPSLREKEPVDEDEEYDNEIKAGGIPSYTGTRRSRNTYYRSSGSGYRTPYIHHPHPDTLADERRRQEERQREEEQRREEEERRQEEEDRRREEDERSYGNWGKNDNGSRGSSSSTSGFNGGGASSDW